MRGRTFDKCSFILSIKFKIVCFIQRANFVNFLCANRVSDLSSDASFPALNIQCYLNRTITFSLMFPFVYHSVSFLLPTCLPIFFPLSFCTSLKSTNLYDPNLYNIFYLVHLSTVKVFRAVYVR